MGQSPEVQVTATLSPQDTLEKVVPDRLIETAFLVCQAGGQAPELAAGAVGQVAAILDAAAQGAKKDFLILLAQQLVQAAKQDSLGTTPHEVLADIEWLLGVRQTVGPLLPNLPARVYADGLQRLATRLLAEEPIRKTGGVTRATALPKDRTTLRTVAQEYGLDLEALRAAVKKAADEGNKLATKGKGPTTTYDEAELRAFAEGFKQQGPKEKKSNRTF